MWAGSAACPRPWTDLIGRLRACNNYLNVVAVVTRKPGSLTSQEGAAGDKSPQRHAMALEGLVERRPCSSRRQARRTRTEDRKQVLAQVALPPRLRPQ